MPPRPLIGALTALVMFSAAPAWGQPSCDPGSAAEEAEALEHLLDDQRRRSWLWNTTWAITFGAATAGQLALAIEPDLAPFEIDEGMRNGLYVGAAKAALGTASRVFLPLSVAHPEPSADPCARRDAALDVLASAAAAQQRIFWFSHLGGIAVHIGAALVLGLAYDTWSNAAISIAAGYPVGIISIYTMPRAAWHAHRRLLEGLSVTPVVTARYRGVALGLTF